MRPEPTICKKIQNNEQKNDYKNYVHKLRL